MWSQGLGIHMECELSKSVCVLNCSNSLDYLTDQLFLKLFQFKFFSKRGNVSVALPVDYD